MARTNRADGDGESSDALRAETMQRGVTQLLFNYLPGRTVDWEDGLAVVQIGGLRLSAAWDDERATTLLEEIDSMLEAWKGRGGRIDPEYPDPRNSQSRFSVGPPDGVEAHVLDTAYICRSCSRLHFLQIRQLSANPDEVLKCRRCRTRTLRQFGFVFVHGCGELVPVSEWVPATKRQEDGSLVPSKFPLRCRSCSNDSDPSIPARSERVRDMQVVCAKCRQIIEARLTANCERCVRRIARAHGTGTEEEDGRSTAISQVAMRVSRYSASEAYYPQTLTILRLDRPTLKSGADPMLDPIEGLIPAALQRNDESASPDDLMALARRLKEAETAGNDERAQEIRERIATLATARHGRRASEATHAETQASTLPNDLTKSIRESVALRTTVHSRSAQDIAQQGGGASSRLLDRVNRMASSLGLAELLIVDDLPIFNAAFGYTRRSFEPTYRELSADTLPTEIRVFPSLDEYAARRLGRPELAGTVPIPAREGEHEGLYISLDPRRVREWLIANGVRIESEFPNEFIPSLLQGLEPIDRYHDGIWGCHTRRLVFGLVHSISHMAMKAAARLAGMQRTSLSEYLFLPLFGTVIYDNATEFQMGGLRTMARDHLGSFLDALGEEATKCLYDPDCLDHRGACHGCIHSPDICCRVFNHGLSRSFLIGGHAPWSDLASEERVMGYWEIADH